MLSHAASGRRRDILFRDYKMRFGRAVRSRAKLDARASPPSTFTSVPPHFLWRDMTRREDCQIPHATPLFIASTGRWPPRRQTMPLPMKRTTIFSLLDFRRAAVIDRFHARDHFARREAAPGSEGKLAAVAIIDTDIDFYAQAQPLLFLGVQVSAAFSHMG